MPLNPYSGAGSAGSSDRRARPSAQFEDGWAGYRVRPEPGHGVVAPEGRRLMSAEPASAGRCSRQAADPGPTTKVMS